MTDHNYRSWIESGDQLRDAESFDAAIEVYRRAIAAEPENALGHYKLGVTLVRMKREEEAEASYREALRLDPLYAEAANNLGTIFFGRRDFVSAELCFRDALLEKIDYFEAHLNVAETLAKSAKNAEAIYHYRRALQLQPNSAACREKLGTLFVDISRNKDADQLLKSAIELDPQRPHAWAALARNQFAVGNLADAEISNREAIKLDPEIAAAWQNTLLGTNYRGEDRDTVFHKHLEFGRYLSRTYPAQDPSVFFNSLDPNKRLRVGFVSGDLRRHSVSHFVEAFLTALNHSQIEPWAFYNYRTEDFRAAELKRRFAEWRNISNVDDDDLVNLIRNDRIDILIDLSGHTGHSRAKLFAKKAAPIQVSWIGYPNTTGIFAIDYRFTDAWADPEGSSDKYHTEKLVRLPATFLCYSPPFDAPEVKPPPSSSGKPFTFGSFNSMVKISDESLGLWAKVLSAVSGSRLMIKSVGAFHDRNVKTDLVNRLQNAGIDPDRVLLKPPEKAVSDHLATYGEVDVALDTFPYHGTTTTCEALWMGVPVITLAGDRHAARVGVSLLNNVGLGDLVANSPEEYVEIAKELAESPARLENLRGNMRQRLQNSVLLDGVAMARNLETALREIWGIYCNQSSALPGPSRAPAAYTVKMHGGFNIVVPKNILVEPSTWVALEQENWFENEIGFVQKLCSPNWQTVDVGANHGMYSLALAKAGARKIWAFEPNQEYRCFLRDSVLENGFEQQIEVLPYGLSAIEVSSEFRLSTLDAFCKSAVVTGTLDFLKLEADGEELNILRGGLMLFANHSPLVMFECRNNNAINEDLVAAFKSLGYEIYQLLSSIDCLVPIENDRATGLEIFVHNLFACKPDKANVLVQSGHLLRNLDNDVLPPVSDWYGVICSQVFSSPIPETWDTYRIADDYGDAFACWCSSRDCRETKSRRLQFLRKAFDTIQKAMDSDDGHPSIAILAIRICFDLGLRVSALAIANAFIAQMGPDDEFPMDRPVPPAYPAFDGRLIKTSIGKFVYQSVVELLVDKSAHSLYFRDAPASLIENGLANPEHTSRLERISILTTYKCGLPILRSRYPLVVRESDDNLNPEIWSELILERESRA